VEQLAATEILVKQRLNASSVLTVPRDNSVPTLYVLMLPRVRTTKTAQRAHFAMMRCNAKPRTERSAKKIPIAQILLIFVKKENALKEFPARTLLTALPN